MPVKQDMMKAMMKEYGKEKGKKVYYAVEAKKKNSRKKKK